MLAAGFFILPSRWFALHSVGTYLANMGYGDRLRGADCKVLIYGDSAGMIGVDPLVIQQMTGLSACNIAEYAGITAINGTMVPDHYLENNPRPRYMVFMYGPDDYAKPLPWKDMNVVEGIIYRLQHKRDISTVLLLLAHPSDVIAWLEQGIHFAFVNLRRPSLTEQEANIREVERGRFPLNGPALQECQKVREAEPDLKWISELRSRYGVQGTRVLVDVVPVPVCDETFLYYKQKLQGVSDNTLDTYPLADYVSMGHLHLGPEGVRRLSITVGDQIAQIERTQ